MRRYGYYLARDQSFHGHEDCSGGGQSLWIEAGFALNYRDSVKNELHHIPYGPFDGVSVWIDDDYVIHVRLVYTDWFDNRHPNNHPPKVRDL